DPAVLIAPRGAAFHLTPVDVGAAAGGRLDAFAVQALAQAIVGAIGRPGVARLFPGEPLPRLQLVQCWYLLGPHDAVPGPQPSRPAAPTTAGASILLPLGCGSSPPGATRNVDLRPCFTAAS